LSDFEVTNEEEKDIFTESEENVYGRQGKKLANGISHGINHLHQRRDVMQ
jgi:hypothetical protein